MSKSGPSEQDRALWQAVMRDVRPLRRRATAANPVPPAIPPAAKPPASRKSATPRQIPQPPPAKPPSELSHGHAAGVDRRSAERLSRGRLAIDGRLDLHGLTQAAAFDRLVEFIARAEAAGKRCVLVITGKGAREGGGVLREQVPRWLNLPPNRGRVLAFDYARPQHGGSGALYVLLKRRRDL
jgi:DNA-nicking Smr family endonuclease